MRSFTLLRSVVGLGWGLPLAMAACSSGNGGQAPSAGAAGQAGASASTAGANATAGVAGSAGGLAGGANAGDGSGGSAGGGGAAGSTSLGGVGGAAGAGGGAPQSFLLPAFTGSAAKPSANTGTRNAGHEFTVAAGGVVVRDLGVWDNGADGLSAAHTVTLFA